MSNTSSSSEASTTAPYTEQPTPVQEVVAKDPMTGFFAVGIVVNIVMIIAFFIWARRQWKKTSKPNE